MCVAAGSMQAPVGPRDFVFAIASDCHRASFVATPHSEMISTCREMISEPLRLRRGRDRTRFDGAEQDRNARADEDDMRVVGCVDIVESFLWRGSRIAPYGGRQSKSDEGGL